MSLIQIARHRAKSILDPLEEPTISYARRIIEDVIDSPTEPAMYSFGIRKT